MVLTARNQPDDVQKAIALGARDFLAKPFKDEQLLARVYRLFRRSRLPIASGCRLEALTHSKSLRDLDRELEASRLAAILNHALATVPKIAVQDFGGQSRLSPGEAETGSQLVSGRCDSKVSY